MSTSIAMSRTPATGRSQLLQLLAERIVREWLNEQQAGQVESVVEPEQNAAHDNRRDL